MDCTALKTDPTQSTSQTLIVNVRGQDRRFIHTVGANRGFVAEDLDSVLARPPRVLHIGYFLILPNLDAHALAARFRRARAAGTLTLLDVATPGPGQYVDRLKVVLPETDIFVPNTDEAELILGESDPVLQARGFRAMGARRVVITLGERGVVSLSDELEVRLGVFPVNYIDGSGGGDAFNAGYILGLLDGRPEIECLKLASAIGASCVRAVGTTDGVFTRAEAEAFLGGHELAAQRSPEHFHPALLRRSATGHLLQVLGVPGPLHRDLRGRGLDLAEVVGRELDVGRPEVLVQAMQLRGARDRDDPRLLGEQPGERDLGRRRLLASRDLAEQVDQGLVRLDRLRREARDGVAEVGAVEGRVLVDLAGEEALARAG